MPCVGSGTTVLIANVSYFIRTYNESLDDSRSGPNCSIGLIDGEPAEQRGSVIVGVAVLYIRKDCAVGSGGKAKMAQTFRKEK